jgi:hypothetical protein
VGNNFNSEQHKTRDERTASWRVDVKARGVKQRMAFVLQQPKTPIGARENATEFLVAQTKPFKVNLGTQETSSQNHSRYKNLPSNLGTVRVHSQARLHLSAFHRGDVCADRSYFIRSKSRRGPVTQFFCLLTAVTCRLLLFCALAQRRSPTGRGEPNRVSQYRS